MNPRPRVLSAFVCLALWASPTGASAQQRSYAAGLSDLNAAVAGTYGDEGAGIAPALDRMASGLAEWDRDLRQFEAEVASAAGRETPTAVARLRTELARRYAQRGRLPDALREVDAALGIDPLAFPAQVFRARLLEALSRTTEAASAFRAAWEQNRADPIAAYDVLRHVATIDQSHRDAAQDTLLAAYRRLLDDGRREKASPFPSVDGLTTRENEELGIAPALYRHAYAAIARGDYAEAIVEFRKAAASDPLLTDPLSRSAALTQAVAALRQGRLAAARSLIEHAPGFDASSEAHRVLGLIEWSDARYDNSIDALTTAIRLNPRDERSRLALSRVLSTAGRDEDAERTLHEMLQVLPDSALGHMWLGTLAERSNRVSDARHDFEQAAEGVTSGRGAFFATLAQLADAAGDLPAAIEAFTHAIAARPNDEETHTRFARALLEQDRADEAFRELIAAVLIDPRDAGAHFGIGQIQLNAGRIEDAVAPLRRAIQIVPGYTEARYALATALTRLGRTSEAAQEFERVEQAQREATSERSRLMVLATIKEEAVLRTAEGDYDRATALWQQAIEREPNRPSHHVDFAGMLERAGRVEQAIEQYALALKLGADPGVYRRLADLYSSLGRVDDAARARASYTRALQRDVTSGGAP